MTLRQPSRHGAMVAGDFQCALAVRPCARTAHFTLHYVDAKHTIARTFGARDTLVGLAGARARAENGKPPKPELSTDIFILGQTLVDECGGIALAARQDDLLGGEAARCAGQPRLGLVIPKRWAKRSVTRNLIRRLARAAFLSCAKELSAGDWALRLRATIDPRVFHSASSIRLKSVLQQELATLFCAALNRQGVPRQLANRGDGAELPQGLTP